MSDMEKENCGSGCGCGPTSNKYWQDVENKQLPQEQLNNEFADGEFDSFSIQKNRRSFLKLMGFSLGALPLTGCKIPVRSAVPYLKKSDVVLPGVANWYASTFEGTPVLVKTREGRPIKIEGNTLSTFTQGGVGSIGQASLIPLYDSNRYRGASIGGSDVSWAELDKQLAAVLREAKGSKYLVTKTLRSPSEVKLINEFSRKLGVKHIAYEAVSESAKAMANKKTHGAYANAQLDFTRADLIVSFEADFLGADKNSTQYTRDYTSRRDLEKTSKLNRLVQIESTMTLTGSNADSRFTKSATEQSVILLAVLNALTGEGKAASAENAEIAKVLVKELKGAAGKSLVLAGSNDVNTQIIVNKINDVLGNYGKTIKIYSTPHEVVANDADFVSMVEEMNAGKVGAALFVGVNPAYDYFAADRFTAGLEKVEVSVSFALAQDETSKLCKYIAPNNHTYESWSDNLIGNNEVSFTQPTIQALFGSRMYTETLLALMGSKDSFYDYMKKNWKASLHPKQNKIAVFNNFWNKSLHDGVVTLNGLSKEVRSSVGSVKKYANSLASQSNGVGLGVKVYQKVNIMDGRYANNPFLQENPDPITKATWDNYIMISPMLAEAQKLATGDVVEIRNENHAVEAPVLVQPGQDINSVSIAAGYGRKVAGKVAKGVGVNAFGFVSFNNGAFSYDSQTIAITKTDKTKAIALTQTHHSMEGRDIVRETTFEQWKSNPSSGNKKAKIVNIYPGHDYSKGHQWAMAIDLNKCTGCSSCIVSCNLENNIPVVGRQEVHRRREMHWMRIDRYYAGDENNPEVVHQPMTCQHCENAPCENVCPVMAIAHSSDGLNQQVYNRCVGTRYCANNCPYKVRRFNWFTYAHDDKYENMALNPDISVRTRGIMEKCTMCIQRIQEGKLEAKKVGEGLKDGAIKTACQQSCPADAIVFGDKNDPNSKIAKYLENERNYTVLEELNVQPRVSYLTKVRNK
jgi:Fe-S-cluster-containing dehydrogenase component/anaerobic selenocysteine-containing dehydrogenase